MPKDLKNRGRGPVADDVDDDPYAEDGGDDNGEPEEETDGSGDGGDDNGDGEPVGKSLGIKTTQVEGEAAYVADAETFVKGISQHLSKSVRAVFRDALQSDEFREVIREEVLRLNKPIHTLLKGMDGRLDARHEEADRFMTQMENWSVTVDDTNATIQKSLTDLGDVSVLSKSIATFNETASASIEAAKTTPQISATGAAPVTSGTESVLHKGVISGSAADAATLPASDAQRQEIGKLVEEAETLQTNLNKSVPGYGPMVDLISGGHPISGDAVEKLRTGIASVKGQ